MPPDYGQGATQMFSQRNNPYCDLLSETKIIKVYTQIRKNIKILSFFILILTNRIID